MQKKQQYVFKVLLLGDGGVGKTSLLRRFIDNKFTPDYKSTIGVQFMTRSVELDGDKFIKLVIWDVAGQSKFTSYRHLYYKDAEGIILVYDLTRNETFKNLDMWISDAVKHTAKQTQIAILGNKVDLQDSRAVTPESGEIYARQKNAVLFSETSAKTGLNVENAFIALTRNILNRFPQ
ncbi:MAG: GTP-binding protein [Candidatus Helarchaeota archaeon]